MDKWHQILNANKPANGSPVSAAGGQRSNGNADMEVEKDKMEDEMTSATKNLDLNWKGVFFFFVFKGSADHVLKHQMVMCVVLMRWAALRVTGIWMLQLRQIRRFCRML